MLVILSDRTGDLGTKVTKLRVTPVPLMYVSVVTVN